MLLVGAGLLMRSFVALQSVDLGMDPENILVARLPLPSGAVHDRGGQAAASSVRSSMRLQGASRRGAATETSTLPPYGGIGSDIEIPGKTHSERGEPSSSCAARAISRPSDCASFGTDVLSSRGQRRAQGRGGESDARQEILPEGRPARTAHQAQVSRDVAASPSRGSRLRDCRRSGDAKNQGIQEPVRPSCSSPTRSRARSSAASSCARGDPAALLNTVRREIWAVDRDVALTLTGTLTDYLKQFSYAEPRFSLVLLTVFAAWGCCWWPSASTA